MSSLWSSAASGASPFTAQATAPTPGGGAAAKFQSILQSASKRGQSSSRSAVQPGLSPAAARASANAAGGAVATSNSASSGTSDSDAVISANDFLTLLVTEMQNQDPTADVDPNAYIDQLVQINSLEQLISINQNLAEVLGAASSTSHQATSAAAAQSRPGVPGSSPAAAVGAAREASQPVTVQGNLSAPGTAPAAHAVGHALDGRARGAMAGHGIRDIPTRALP